MKLGVIGGAGLLGSTSAFLAGMKGYLEEIKLIDIKENLAKSHVLDMGQAIFSSSKTTVSYGEYKDLSDCGIILISASIPESTRFEIKLGVWATTCPRRKSMYDRDIEALLSRESVVRKKDKSVARLLLMPKDFT